MKQQHVLLLMLMALLMQSCGKDTSTGIPTASPYPPKFKVGEFSSGFSRPAGLAIDSLGNIFVMNLLTGVVNKIDPTGAYSNFATGGGYGSAVAIGPGCRVYASYYYDGTVKSVPPGGGFMVTYASGFSNPSGLCFDNAGTLYVAETNANIVTTISSAGVRRTYASGLSAPIGLALDGNGYLYVANRNSNSISRISTTGVDTTYVYDIVTPHSLAFDRNGGLYASQSGNNVGDGNSISVATLDGFVYQLSHAFDTPAGIVFD